MKRQPDADKLAVELRTIRDLIDGHENVQQLLDLAGDDADRRAVALERSRIVAWRVTSAFGALSVGAFIIAGAAVATAMGPAPPPEILVVDKASGLVQPLISLATFQMDPEEATIRRNVNTFILSREGYSYEQADTHYYTTAAFLSPQLQAEWGKKWDKSNPESPPNLYKKDTRVRPKVGAITILRNGLGAIIGARVSLTKTIVVNDVPEGPPTNWIANVSFHWVNQPTNERDRRINDLGMEVTDYIADRDIGASRPTADATLARQVPEPPKTSPMALVAPSPTPQVAP
jgi:type IV secretion system protein VirB8